MKHIGQTLKNHIESSGMTKRSVAKAAGITDNYLSMIFGKDTIDCELFEKLCLASGMDPSAVFDCPTCGDYDITENSDVVIQLLREKDLRIAEMERTINILMSLLPPGAGTQSEQTTQN